MTTFIIIVIGASLISTAVLLGTLHGVKEADRALVHF